jgi:hypothetical protein
MCDGRCEVRCEFDVKVHMRVRCEVNGSSMSQHDLFNGTNITALVKHNDNGCMRAAVAIVMVWLRLPRFRFPYRERIYLRLTSVARLGSSEVELVNQHLFQCLRVRVPNAV